MRTARIARTTGLASVFLGLLAALIVVGSSPQPALAATITVNTFIDELNADGDCSLREAVVSANTNAAVDACTAGSGADTINLQTGVGYPLMLGGVEDAALTGDLDLMGSLTIVGNDTTVKALPASGDRVFTVLVGATVNISGINVQEGNANVGGGILNFGTLTLTNSTVRLNTAGSGAGVYSTGALTVNSSTINNNAGSVSGAGIYNVSGFVTVDGSTVTANTATIDGGGIYSGGGFLTMTNSTVSDNDATANGGGVYVTVGTTFTATNIIVSGNDANLGAAIYKAGAGSVTMTDSSVDDNGTFGSGEGGGIYVLAGAVTLNNSEVRGNSAAAGGGVYVSGGIGASLTLNDSTVNGNSADSGGGGIYALASSTLTRSTVSNNFAGNAAGGVYVGAGTFTANSSTISGNDGNSSGGGIYVGGGTFTVNSSTVAGNRAAVGAGIHNSAGAVDINGTIIANSGIGTNCSGAAGGTHNLSSDGTCAAGAATLTYTNPLLGPLANNGGLTRTHALLAGSPAVDAGVMAWNAACSGGDDFDQRGVQRPQGLRCDIGAYEANDSDGDGTPDPLDLDDDDDTVPDALDSCPLVSEDIDGYQDGDGCPDTDNDLDGICDAGQTSVSCTGSDTGRYLWQNPLGATVDCRNAAEDIDSFHDTDGCPEPDNDYDNFPDGTDDCPGTDYLAGPNGISDFGGDEPTLYLTPYQSREDFDGVIDWDGCHDSPNDDYDGDGAGDETEVFMMQTDPVNPDTDADTRIDGTDNCPNWPNTSQALPAWTVPANDSDCDGFNKTREEWVGTDATKHCNADSIANNEAVDFWPTDFNDSRFTSLADVVLMGPVYNQSTGTDPAKKRFDLNASGIVSLADVVLMGPFYNKGCG